MLVGGAYTPYEISSKNHSCIDYRYQVKDEMINDTMNIVDPIYYDRTALLDVIRQRLSDRSRNRWGGEWNQQRLNQELHHILKGQIPRKFGEMPRKKGKYERIAPSKNYDKICKLYKGR